MCVNSILRPLKERGWAKPPKKLPLNRFFDILGQTKRGLWSIDKEDHTYADMVAHRETGESLTGATYAALPYGPHLNNYKDLVQDIIRADESEAESFSREEKRIITRIAMKFPEERMACDAAHKEPIWKNKPNGAIIPYTDSAELIGV